MVGTSTWCDSRRLCRDPDFLAGAPADSPIYTEVNNSSSRRFFTGLDRKRSFLRSFQVYLARQGLALESGLFSCKNLYSKHSSDYVMIQNKNMYFQKPKKNFTSGSKDQNSFVTVKCCGARIRIVKKEISKVVKN
jgi:hypothetical protein